MISKEFDHFTGFSVLLGNTRGDGGDGDGCEEASGEFETLQWLSISFLIAAWVLSAINCLMYYVVTKRQAAIVKEIQARSKAAVSNRDF